MSDRTTDTERPLLRVVRGEPTPDELAALVAVVTMRRQKQDATDEPMSLWCDRTPLLRRPIHAGPDAWRAAAREGARTRADW